MFKPFANATRALGNGPLSWKTWVALIAVPLLVMGLLTWAFWSPDTDHHTATAAVVNNDEPVTVNGQTIPLGRELAGDLTHDSDSAYTWTLTDATDAASGLADGRYAAVVTIPSDFSARATSTATAKPLETTRAILNVQTSSAAGVADPALSDKIARATSQTLDQQVVQTYLDNVYVAFSTIHGQVNQAADGAGQLADGTSQLTTGAQGLVDGTGQLRAAATELADGANQLANGTAQLETGSSQLETGLTQAQRDSAQLPALTRQLADGAEQVAEGNQQLAATVVPLANRLIAAIDALPSAQSAAQSFQKLADQCVVNGGGPLFCQTLIRAANTFATNANQLDAVRNTIRDAAVQTRDSVQALATGSRQVADGDAQLAQQAVPLAQGIASAANAAGQLNTGARQANTGARQLATGTRGLASGSTDLVTGAQQLDSGTVATNDGAQQLATQLDQGRGQVPDYTDAERAHLKSIAANPIDATTHSLPVGTLALTLFAALALWALALATYTLTRALPDTVLTSREPTWRIIVRAAVPGATAAALAAIAITLIAAPLQHLSIVETLAFLGVTLLAAGSFVAVNQAAAAIFGNGGRVASIAVFVLTAATGVISALPSTLYDITDVLPTHGAITALRAIIAGGSGLADGLIQLAVWLVVGALATAVVTGRRRYLPTRQLRTPTRAV